jgi:hypothetical protein
MRFRSGGDASTLGQCQGILQSGMDRRRPENSGLKSQENVHRDGEVGNVDVERQENGCW